MSRLDGRQSGHSQQGVRGSVCVCCVNVGDLEPLSLIELPCGQIDGIDIDTGEADQIMRVAHQLAANPHPLAYRLNKQARDVVPRVDGNEATHHALLNVNPGGSSAQLASA